MSVLVELERETYLAQVFPPLTLGPAWDPPTALGTAWLAQLAYESDADKIGAILARWGLTREAIVGGPDDPGQRLTATRALVVGTPLATVISFAGTDPLVARNWLSDFSTWTSPDGLHAGFAAAAAAVWPQIAAAAQGARLAGRPLIVTGHSLGAAIACITAMRIRDAGLAEIASVYTFGMPRAGGEGFAAAYGPGLEQRSYRLVHGDDLVPSVPPAGFRVSLPRGWEFPVGIQFRHVGCLVRSGPGKRFAASAPEWPSNEPHLVATAASAVVNALQIALQSGLPPQAQPGWRGRFYRTLPLAIYDHLPAAYLTALGAVLTGEGL